MNQTTRSHPEGLRTCKHSRGVIPELDSSVWGRGCEVLSLGLGSEQRALPGMDGLERAGTRTSPKYASRP